MSYKQTRALFVLMIIFGLMFLGLIITYGTQMERGKDTPEMKVGNGTTANAEPSSLVECVNGIAKVHGATSHQLKRRTITLKGQTVSCRATDGKVDAYLVDGQEIDGYQMGEALNESMNPSD